MKSPFEVPAIKDEVERKAVEAADLLLQNIIDGTVTPKEANLAFDVLWRAVSGLVSSNTTELLQQIGDEVTRLTRIQTLEELEL